MLIGGVRSRYLPAVYICIRRAQNTCKSAGTPMTNSERFVKGIAEFGNLFLILTLPEMRRQGISYLSLLALQRADEAASSGFEERELRDETGLPDFEVSRACKPLIKGGLIKTTSSTKDRRRKILVVTPLGRRVLNTIFSEAAKCLGNSVEEVGRFRRLQGAVEHLRKARRKLRGSMQLSFFERELQRGKRPKVPVPRKPSIHPVESQDQPD